MLNASRSNAHSFYYKIIIFTFKHLLNPRSNTGATYKTSIRSSSMMLETTVTGSGTFSITGNLGADGSGYAQAQEYEIQGWKVFRKSLYNTRDPEINHLILLSNSAANSGVVQSYYTVTHNENHRIMNIVPGTQLIYVMYATNAYQSMSNAEHEALIELILQQDGVAVTPVCYNGTYVVPNDSSTLNDFSTYASVETYESTVNLICVPDPCDSEPPIANYTGSGCASTATNATCDVNCDQGYHQVNGPATCYAGVWQEPLPTCEEDPCPNVRFVFSPNMSLVFQYSTPSIMFPNFNNRSHPTLRT